MNLGITAFTMPDHSEVRVRHDGSKTNGCLTAVNRVIELSFFPDVSPAMIPYVSTHVDDGLPLYNRIQSFDDILGQAILTCMGDVSVEVVRMSPIISSVDIRSLGQVP